MNSPLSFLNKNIYFVFITLVLIANNIKCETKRYRIVKDINLSNNNDPEIYSFTRKDAVSSFKSIEPEVLKISNQPSSYIDITIKPEEDGKSSEPELKEHLEVVESKTKDKYNDLERGLLDYVERTLQIDKLEIMSGVNIVPIERNTTQEDFSSRSFNDNVDDDGESFDQGVLSRVRRFASTHALNVKIPETGRFFFKFATGKSSFLTGFGLGFLAFGLKKLMFPLFIGMQIIKSILLAMFLPSILGSIGKIVGKGVSSFSGFSNNAGAGQTVDDLDFKDGMGYGTEQDAAYGMTQNDYSYPSNMGGLQTQNLYNAAVVNNAMSRFGPGGQKVAYVNTPSDDYYTRHNQKKQENFKVFHDIPASSMILTKYDPFYSPLLSRLDVVFQQIGFATTEPCRERLICMMYANPAKYAPYSNLVSAQLSRELNELKKPSTDNPDILRFFKYMKAAKDGQDGVDCAIGFKECSTISADANNPAMISTYNDINKLVQARKI